MQESASAGIGPLLFGVIPLIVMFGGYIIFLVAVWRGMKAHESIAMSLCKMAGREAGLPYAESALGNAKHLSSEAVDIAKEQQRLQQIKSTLTPSERMCPQCGTKYKLTDYDQAAAQWLCSKCKNSLVRE